VIVVMVRDKNSSNVANVDSRLRKPAGNAIARINDIMRPIDG
jgi:hypothetical protein